MERLRRLWEDTDVREIGLTVFTGLVVAYVRYGLEHHWQSWNSIEDFLVGWFVHTLAVGLLMAVSAAAIIYSHKFFLGYERKEYGRELGFYILMTILVTAVCIALVAHWPMSDGLDDF